MRLLFRARRGADPLDLRRINFGTRSLIRSFWFGIGLQFLLWRHMFDLPVIVPVRVLDPLTEFAKEVYR